jgi:folate-dependent phosphoribosylglycinamide formyltransferase PurN
MTLRIGWFSTGAGKGSQRQRLLTAVVEDIRRGDMDAEIAFVFCNRERGEYEDVNSYLDLVDSFGLRCLTLSSRQFRRDRGGALSKPGQPLPPWRAEYDSQVAEIVAPYLFDIGMLAGYMLIFTGEVCNRYTLLNLHPAEPGGPVGTWKEVNWELIDKRAEGSGVLLNLATEELDRGPPAAYCTYPLRGPTFDPLWEALEGRSAAEVREAEGEDHPLFREVRRHGAEREIPLVVATLRAFAQGRVRIQDRRVVDGQGRELPRGLDLTAEIDDAVAPLLATS